MSGLHEDYTSNDVFCPQVGQRCVSEADKAVSQASVEVVFLTANADRRAVSFTLAE